MIEDDNNSEEDSIKCCGGGCNNCVLDEKSFVKDNQKEAKSNLLTTNGRCYLKFSIRSISAITENVRRIVFAYVDNMNCDRNLLELQIPPGHHVYLRVPIDVNKHQKIERHDLTTDGDFISRPFTPIHINKNENEFHILVKFEPFGVMSEYLRNCTIGQVIDVKGPYGSFEWIPCKVSNLICISQGVGIAPMYSIAQTILENENDETKIHFISCFRCLNDVLLRDEMYDLQQYWNFQSQIYLSHEDMCKCCIDVREPNCLCIKSRLKYNEMICTYRLDEIELSKIFINQLKGCYWILVCGKNDFIKFIKISLKKLHVKEEHIFGFD